MAMINTLRIAKELEEKGLPRGKAEAVADAMLEFRTHKEQEWVQRFIEAGYTPQQAVGLVQVFELVRENSGHA